VRTKTLIALRLRGRRALLDVVRERSPHALSYAVDLAEAVEGLLASMGEHEVGDVARSSEKRRP
jgi:hypothetical protein